MLGPILGSRYFEVDLPHTDCDLSHRRKLAPERCRAAAVRNLKRDVHVAAGKEDGETPPPPLPAPDLFDAVAEEWQRLRLAMQDVY